MMPLVTFTRRVALALLVVAPLPLVLPRRHGGEAASEGPGGALAARLRRALAEVQLPFPAVLELVDLRVDAAAPLRLAAVVRMTWAPGLRQRRFAVEAADEAAALAALVAAVRARFSAA